MHTGIAQLPPDLKIYNILRISVPNSSILIKIFPRTHGPEVFLVACLLLLVLSLIPGSKAIGNADGTGNNGSFISTRNEKESVLINIIVLLWTFYLRFKVWLRYWSLGCELIQSYYTSRENIVRLKSDLRFESIISHNIDLHCRNLHIISFSFLVYTSWQGEWKRRNWLRVRHSRRREKNF